MTANGSSAVLGAIGRKRISWALTDACGAPDLSTVRSYDARAVTSVSGSLSEFQRDLSLGTLPRRSAVAVAGLARGDAVSVTRTPWFVSRSGLAAMLGEPPLIINDFAAEAWALHAAEPVALQVFAGALPTVRAPGCYCILGMTSGLGSALLIRDGAGSAVVQATEAGHGAFAPPSEDLAQLVEETFPGRRPVAVEEIVSAPGLVAIYTALAKRQRLAPRLRTPEEVTRGAATDPLARQACEALSRCFWAVAGHLAVTYGAWDGIVVTGKVAAALRPTLRLPTMAAAFAGTSKYQRLLAQVPRVLIELENGALIGAAEALRHQASRTPLAA